MRTGPDDDADELHQFTVLTTKAARLGYALERTAHGYRLDAPGVLMHRTDLDGVALVFERPPGLNRHLQ